MFADWGQFVDGLWQVHVAAGWLLEGVAGWWLKGVAGWWLEVEGLVLGRSAVCERGL